MTTLTPVQQHGADYWLKRDDLFTLGGVSGGKVRTCNEIMHQGMAKGKRSVVTAGSRSSPQVNIVAHLAAFYGLPCRVHVPSGELSPEVKSARDVGADVVQHRPGYNSVIVARAKADAEKSDAIYIPFGMECAEAVKQTAAQVKNLPLSKIGRIVVPVGSGMSLAGIVTGLGKYPASVVGVAVGADPTKRIETYAPKLSACSVRIEIPLGDYHKPAKDFNFNGVLLDPYYEAKCLPFLKPGDLLWVVGIRQTVLAR